MGAPVAQSVSVWYLYENIFMITKQKLSSVGILFNINSTKFYQFFFIISQDHCSISDIFMSIQIQRLNSFLSFSSFFVLMTNTSGFQVRCVFVCSHLSFVKYFLPKLLFHPLPLKRTIHECIQLSSITSNKANSTWEVLFHLPASLRREIN